MLRCLTISSRSPVRLPKVAGKTRELGLLDVEAAFSAGANSEEDDPLEPGGLAEAGLVASPEVVDFVPQAVVNTNPAESRSSKTLWSFLTGARRRGLIVFRIITLRHSTQLTGWL